MSFYRRAGYFAKSTGAAPVDQSIKGLGFPPKVVWLFATSRTATGIGAGSGGVSRGFTAGASASWSVSGYSADGALPSNASRRYAAKALTIVGATESLVAECDLKSFDSDGFTVSWTTNDANAVLIGYLAIGGDEVTASVVTWTTPTATGNKAVTGAGFLPDYVEHLSAGNGATTAPPNSQTASNVMIGAMSTADQWVALSRTADNQPLNTDTDRYQSTTQCLFSVSAAGATQFAATYVSMDSDGFTTNFGTVTASANYVGSLCIKGPRVDVGAFAKSTSAAPVNQTVSGLGWPAAAVLFATTCNTAAAGAAAHARLSVGASDYANSVACGAADEDSNPVSGNVDQWFSATKAAVKVNNATATIDAEAAGWLTGSDGYTVRWTTNDGTATEFFYAAFSGRTIPEWPIPHGHVGVFRGIE